MELRHLRYFLAVAEELHFGRAALRLHIVQPALSKQIASLEQELGVRLFERTKRHVQLTEAGTVLLEDARHILTQAEGAVQRAHLASRGEIGSLSVGFIAPALYELLPRLLRRYRARYPQVRLLLKELHNVEAVDGVLGRQLDLAFVRLPLPAHPELNCATVHEEPVMLAIPDNHPLAGSDQVALTELADEPIIMIPRSQEPILFDYYTSMCAEAGFSPTVVHEVNRTPVAVGLVAGGLGLAFVPSSARLVAHPGVAYVPLVEPGPRLIIGMVWRSGPTPPLLRSFLSLSPWSRIQPDDTGALPRAPAEAGAGPPPEAGSTGQDVDHTDRPPIGAGVPLPG
ncbi:LysR substrate-binding domain-containing protein [Modestobacter lapidis]|nr:LysR family transcriptional regulator [Modestobacter lapidis]